MKKILLISYNFAPELTGIGRYNGEMVEWLTNNGFECSVITAYPYYPSWKVQESHKQKRFFYSREKIEYQPSGNTATIFRCPMYVPVNPTGVRRVLADLSFFIMALIRILFLAPQKKFDVIFSVAPSFLVGVLALIYKILRNGKTVYHIQDLQIEAAQELRLIKSPALIRMLFKLEKIILERSDLVSTVSEVMAAKVRAKTSKSVYVFPNWADIGRFYPMPNAGLKLSFGFSEFDKIILYSGSIGEKQGLEAIVSAAHALQSRTELKFIICGSGPHRTQLQSRASQLKLTNLFFLPLQPENRLNHFLNVADVHLVIQKPEASDLVMPSKLVTILAVGGLALVTANPGTGLHELVTKHKVGIVIDANDQEALNNRIVELSTNKYAEIKSNARAYAEETLSRDTIMNRFTTHLSGYTDKSKQKQELTQAIAGL